MDSFLMTNLEIDVLTNIIQEAVKSEVTKINLLEQKKEPKLLTTDELCSKLQKSKVTLSNWRKKGYLPYKRISRKIYYDWNEVLEAIPTIECKGGKL